MFLCIRSEPLDVHEHESGTEFLVGNPVKAGHHRGGCFPPDLVGCVLADHLLKLLAAAVCLRKLLIPFLKGDVRLVVLPIDVPEGLFTVEEPLLRFREQPGKFRNPFLRGPRGPGFVFPELPIKCLPEIGPRPGASLRSDHEQRDRTTQLLGSGKGPFSVDDLPIAVVDWPELCVRIHSDYRDVAANYLPHPLDFLVRPGMQQETPDRAAENEHQLRFEPLEAIHRRLGRLFRTIQEIFAGKLDQLDLEILVIPFRPEKHRRLLEIATKGDPDDRLFGCPFLEARDKGKFRTCEKDLIVKSFPEVALQVLQDGDSIDLENPVSLRPGADDRVGNRFPATFESETETEVLWVFRPQEQEVEEPRGENVTAILGSTVKGFPVIAGKSAHGRSSRNRHPERENFVQPP